MYELIFRFSAAWCLTLVVTALNVIIYNDPYTNATEGMLSMGANALFVVAVWYIIEYLIERKAK